MEILLYSFMILQAHLFPMQLIIFNHLHMLQNLHHQGIQSFKCVIPKRLILPIYHFDKNHELIFGDGNVNHTGNTVKKCSEKMAYLSDNVSHSVPNNKKRHNSR